MKSLISSKDRTVLIVSHNMDTLSDLCSRILWMHDGKVRMFGNTDDVIRKYTEFMEM